MSTMRLSSLLLIFLFCACEPDDCPKGKMIVIDSPEILRSDSLMTSDPVWKDTVE